MEGVAHSGRKNTKHKDFGGIIPGLGGGQEVYVKHRAIFVYDIVCVLLVGGFFAPHPPKKKIDSLENGA